MEIDIEKLIKKKDIDLLGWLICKLLEDNNSKLLENYCINYQIPTSVFDNLLQHGYISTTKKLKENYTIHNIHLLDKFKREFGKIEISNIDTVFEFAWKQILLHYPNKVKNGVDVRHLHTDLATAKLRYKNYIIKKGVFNQQEHDFILRAIQFIVAHKTKSGNLGFMQALPTFINQRNWEAVRDDVNEIILSGKNISDGQELKEDRL